MNVNRGNGTIHDSSKEQKNLVHIIRREQHSGGMKK